jgi:Protein of unknown function DUF2834
MPNDSAQLRLHRDGRPETELNFKFYRQATNKMAASSSQWLRYVYLALCVVGVLLPYWQFVPWFLQHGFDLPLFLHQLFANRIGGFFGLDVIVASFVLWVFVFAEGGRLGMRNLWLPVVGSLLFGVSLGLPLFLYMRQVHLDKAAI